MTCPHFQRGCNGCAHWDKSYPVEISIKKKDLADKIKFEPRVKTPSHFDLRTRFDFTLENGKMGLYSRDHKLIDLPSCPILHPELEKAFQYLRNFDFGIKKGSLRLRLAPDLKTWGLWLDFANIDIKHLLDEKTLLTKLSEKFIIEIGQKKKRLSSDLKLIDPLPFPWFKTLDQELLCCIASFTQPSWETADLLTEEILQWTGELQPQKVIEYGCGIGQYTLPLAQKYKMQVFESDLFALDCLQKNVTSKNLILNGEFTSGDLALVNPPRSGLKSFTDKLMQSNISSIIYISCFPESLAQDLQVLSTNYKLNDAVLVDQFPRSKHYETGVLLQRI